MTNTQRSYSTMYTLQLYVDVIRDLSCLNIRAPVLTREPVSIKSESVSNTTRVRSDKTSGLVLITIESSRGLRQRLGLDYMREPALVKSETLNPKP